MGYLKYTLILLLGFTTQFAKAQSLTFPQVDSISYAQYMAGNWTQLASFGNEAVSNGIDFPGLRLRVGYAYFSMGNYSGALNQYQHVIANDKGNDTARYFAYLCNKYLNRDAEAFYHTSYLAEGVLKSEEISPFGLVQAGAETSVKFPQNDYRGNAFYTRVSLNNKLGNRLLLDESLAYFTQPITVQNESALRTSNDNQTEYYGKLTYAIFNKLLLVGAYHYFNTGYPQTTYNNNMGLVGIKYTGGYFDAQADVNFSHISGNNVMQYNGKINLYPLGNFNFYTITGITMQQSDSRQYIFSQLAGFKALKNVWLEGSATFGKLSNYFEYDGLYIYNAIDETTFKAAVTLYYQLNRHALLYVNYMFEKKTDTIETINYNQSSITWGVTWKF